jgi:hypothetical protein
MKKLLLIFILLFSSCSLLFNEVFVEEADVEIYIVDASNLNYESLILYLYDIEFVFSDTDFRLLSSRYFGEGEMFDLSNSKNDNGVLVFSGQLPMKRYSTMYFKGQVVFVSRGSKCLI